MSEFVIPKGYRPGLPLMEVSHKALDVHGRMEVDYEGLEEMYFGDLGIPREKPPHVRWQSLKRSIGQFGAISKITKIDPMKAYREFGNTGLIQAMLHEGSHHADCFNHPIRHYRRVVAIETASLGAAVLGSVAAVELLPVPDIPALVAGSASCSLLFNYSINHVDYLYDNNPREKRARLVQENQMLIQKYRGVVDFPDRPRLA